MINLLKLFVKRLYLLKKIKSSFKCKKTFFCQIPSPNKIFKNKEVIFKLFPQQVFFCKWLVSSITNDHYLNSSWIILLSLLALHYFTYKIVQVLWSKISKKTYLYCVPTPHRRWQNVIFFSYLYLLYIFASRLITISGHYHFTKVKIKLNNLS